MVISPEQKKVLLERLQLAKAAKQAKALEKKKAMAVKEPEPPKPDPTPVVVPPVVPPVETTPEPVLEKAPEPIPPPVPDLVKASKNPPKKKKKECFVPSDDDDSDEEEEIALPKKLKGGQKKQAYMKIKIYREPKNATAFQSLIESIQDEEEDRPPASEPIPIPTPNSIGRGVKYASANCNNAAMKKGAGVVSHQEMLRRAALEFFS
jgi:hypothetical protein